MLIAFSSADLCHAALEAMVLLVSCMWINFRRINHQLCENAGTPASVITTLDGYPMELVSRGEHWAGDYGLLRGGLISWGFLILLAEPISHISTELGDFDYFALVLVALVLIASVSGKSLAAGVFSGFLGILVTIPGESPATGDTRWTWGIEQLNNGFDLLPVLIGLFAVSQVIHEVASREKKVEEISPIAPSILGVAGLARHISI